MVDRYIQVVACAFSCVEYVRALGVTTSTDKIFEKNSSFHVKLSTTGKVQFPFWSSLLLVLTKFCFQEEDWALAYNSMKF